MKTTKQSKGGANRWLILAMAGLLAGLALETATAGIQRRIVGTADTEAEEGEETATPPINEKDVVIRSIEPEGGKQKARDLAWLGVSVEEVSEPLTAQLGLKYGQGLLVSYVSKDSPAARADLRKHDVLVEFEGQMLVDPAQLRKLVQMHRDGDNVKVTFYRAGKKQTAEATLVKKNWNESSVHQGTLQADMQELKNQLHGLTDQDRLREEMNVVARSLAEAGLDTEKMSAEIKHTMEQTRKAIQDAMRHSRAGQDPHKVLDLVSKELAELAGRGEDLGKDATVIIKSDGKSAKTIVETDDSGSYIITADPDKHLSAHDKEGKLLFDGAIESPEQQKKVPKEIWEKVKPLLEQMEKGKVEIETPALEKNEPENQKP